MTEPAGAVWTEQRLRARLKHSFDAWCRFVLEDEGLVPARHHELLIEALQDVADGAAPRLMVLLPPGSAKSTIASVMFPAWWLARERDRTLLCTSHTQQLVDFFGRRVRRILGTHGLRLNVHLLGDDRAVSRFGVDNGSGYYATGVGGGVTGRRADVLLIDDPIKSFFEAASLQARDQLWNWFRTDLTTRLKPKGRIVLVMTRWHSDDLAGRLIERGGWRVLRLPAIAEPGDPMGRAVGEALWPGWEDLEALQERRVTLGDPVFNALYQQAPQAITGALFDTEKIAVSDIAPVGRTVRAWDLAGTAETRGDPDWTVGVKLTRMATGRFVVIDVCRFRLGPFEVAEQIAAVAAHDGTEVTVGLPRDPGQAALYQVSHLTQALAGFNVTSSAETGTKVMRAMPVAGQVAVGNMSMFRAGWNRAFLEELGAFPNGRKDDQVDALSRAFMMLVEAAPRQRFSHLPFFER